jgi:amino acid transporter
LTRRRLGVVHIFFFTVAASAPLTVLGGGVTTTFAVTGNPGVPLSFILLAVALGLFTVGYAAMSRYVSNAGAFYAYLAQGIGRAWGVAASFVALLSYNTIQIGLYGLFGASLGSFVADKFGLNAPWWIWGLVAFLIVGTLGLLRVDLNAKVLAVMLILECTAVLVYDLGAATHPAPGTSVTAGFDPSQLFTAGVGAVFAFGIAAFIGFESAAIYSEECRDPAHTVARATYAAVAFTGIFYAASAWAMTINVGTWNLQPAAAAAGPGLVFGALTDHFGTVVADIANILFLTSVFAALLSFHNAVARYVFALGREHVLPGAFSRVSARSRAPIAGSVVQSIIALVTVALFAVGGGDPVLQLFTWFSGIAAVGVVLLMAGTSVAVIGYFVRNPHVESAWQRLIAPSISGVALVGVVVLLVVNFDVLLGSADPTGVLRWALPGLVVLAAAAGLVWGRYLRSHRPDVYEGIGRSSAAEDDAIDLMPLIRHGGV